MFQVPINSIQNIWVIVRKQNFNLIVDAAHPTAIPTNANLLVEKYIEKEISWKYIVEKSGLKSETHVTAYKKTKTFQLDWNLVLIKHSIKILSKHQYKYS